MAEDIRIPSPSVFLSSPTSPSLEPSSTKPPPSALSEPDRKHSSTGNAKNTPATTGPKKPKQTKSRNGCATCKKKRLKCDEAKPECGQCIKRKVPCGGYVKDFKWRTFDEPQLAQKIAPPSSGKIPISASSPVATTKPGRKGSSGSDHSHDVNGPVAVQSPSSPSNHIGGIKTSGAPYFPKEIIGIPSSETSPQISLTELFPRTYDQVSCAGAFAPTFDDTIADPSETRRSSDSSTEDLLNYNQESCLGLTSELALAIPFMRDDFPQDNLSDFDFSYMPRDDEGNAQVDKQLKEKVDEQHLVTSTGSVTPTSLVRGHSNPQRAVTNSLNMMLHQPQVNVGCPDVLFSRFDRETCGILSVKDGPTENGWRTLVLPMARNCPPLYHALAALTSFHLAKQLPSLRQQGIEHMQSSLNGLRSQLPHMRADAAVATSLVLAFAESWDKKITTGIDHIKGACSMLQRAFASHKEKPLSGRDLERLRFLSSTWVYMDVIARLTSTGSSDYNEFDEICQTFSSSCSIPERASPSCPQHGSVPGDAGLDTLMGCAASLFPLVGHTANLVRRVYRTSFNNAPIIARATELRVQLESWSPPPASVFTVPEDPHTSIEDCLKTAEAYRWATLLHLFQAVPEVANRPSEQLAHQTLNLLAMVPLASRAVIVQIYPLVVAGCEMIDQEMREWVKDRWFNMGKKMGIGVIEASQKVVEEVWRRRDEYELRIVPSIDSDLLSSADGDSSISDLFDVPGLNLDEAVSLNSANMLPLKRRTVGDMDFEYTVRGSLHWLKVMKGWEWEILLG